MKTKNYNLKDLIRVWMKACFKRAVTTSDKTPKATSPKRKTARELNKR
jgi:hypothetical protein